MTDFDAIYWRVECDSRTNVACVYILGAELLSAELQRFEISGRF